MHKNWLFIYILCVIFLLGFGIYFVKTSKTQPRLPSIIVLTPSPIPTQSTASPSAELATVKRVIDGDTIELTDGRKVRYIGVDTPELHHPTKGVQCYGKEAMEKNKELVEGKEIRMVKDVSETDRYKRLLRYVYLGNIFINKYLASEGYALQATFPPDIRYAEIFGKAAEEARINNRGLWGICQKTEDRSKK